MTDKKTKDVAISTGERSQASITNYEPRSAQTTLVEMALKLDVSIEKIEKLIDLQYAQEDRETKKALNLALSKFQSKLPAIQKNGLASFPTKGGGKMEYSFVKLEDISKAIKPLLSEFGLSYRWEAEQNQNFTTMTCIVSHEEGARVMASMTASADDSGNKNALQKSASTRSYLKRYTLIEAMGIIVGGEDDDAHTSIEEKAKSGDTYPQEEFELNFPLWEKQIIDGAQTAEKVVAHLNNQGVALSESQLQVIYGVKAQ